MVIWGFVHLLQQQLQGFPHRVLPLAAVQLMPGYGLPGLLHKLIVGLLEALVLPLLPPVVLRHAPLRVRILLQRQQALQLFLSRSVSA